jgi:hypothetical protein
VLRGDYVIVEKIGDKNHLYKGYCFQVKNLSVLLQFDPSFH